MMFKNEIDSISFGRNVLKRLWLALGLDIILTLVGPLFSGPQKLKISYCYDPITKMSRCE